MRSERARYLKLAEANASASLKARLTHEGTMAERISSFEELFGMTDIERMECFDISHTMLFFGIRKNTFDRFLAVCV